MDKQKEIEEMAQAICSIVKDGVKKSCNDCLFGRRSLEARCKWCTYAVQIYEAGYRKADEVRKETTMELLDLLKFGYELPIDDIAKEILEKYGVEVEE